MRSWQISLAHVVRYYDTMINIQSDRPGEGALDMVDGPLRIVSRRREAATLPDHTRIDRAPYTIEVPEEYDPTARFVR